MTPETFTQVVRGSDPLPDHRDLDWIAWNARTGHDAARVRPTSTGDAFCVDDQDQAVDDIAVYVAAVAGTGVTPEPPAGEQTDGKSIFTASCGGCHTLADAGTTGTVGPNLDQAKPPKELVVDRVTNGQGVMPSFKDSLDAAQIQAVADYVSSAAGQVATPARVGRSAPATAALRDRPRRA